MGETPDIRGGLSEKEGVHLSDDERTQIIEHLKEHGRAYMGNVRKSWKLFYSDEILQLVDSLNRNGIRLADVGDWMLKCDWKTLMNRLRDYRKRNGIEQVRMRRSKNRPHIA